MKERTLRDLFHLINRVMPEEQELVSVSSETLVADALSIMSDRDFNQLPVIEGEEVLGVFSHRSFAEGLKKLPSSVTKKAFDPLALPVEEFTEKLRFVHINDELATLFDEFDLKNAVLVGSEDRLRGVVTTIDALRYFYEVASPYVLLREIELAIRELIRASVSVDVLMKCAEFSLKQHYQQTNREMPCALEQMSLHDYVMLLRFQGTWSQFAKAFGTNQDIAGAKLAPLSGLRNDIFHFRRDLTVEEYELLRSSRDWLLRRIRVMEAKNRENEVE